MYVLDDLVVATLPNSPVFNSVVSHVRCVQIQRGVGGALCRAGESGARIPLEAVQGPKVDGSRSGQLRYQSRTGSVQLAVLDGRIWILNAAYSGKYVSGSCINLFFSRERCSFSLSSWIQGQTESEPI